MERGLLESRHSPRRVLVARGQIWLNVISIISQRRKEDVRSSQQEPIFMIVLVLELLLERERRSSMEMPRLQDRLGMVMMYVFQAK
jgi:hypothetical protein